MKLFDKIWSALGLVETEETEEQPVKAKEKSGSRLERKPERTIKPNEEDKPSLFKPTHSVAVSIGQPIGKASLVLTQPNGFDDARQIAENVTNGKTVVVNFARTDTDTTKRTIDFMSGITYAVGGTVQRVSNAIFLFAPANVEIFTNDRHHEDEAALLPWRSQKSGRDH